MYYYMKRHFCSTNCFSVVPSCTVNSTVKIYLPPQTTPLPLCLVTTLLPMLYHPLPVNYYSSLWNITHSPITQLLIPKTPH